MTLAPALWKPCRPPFGDSRKSPVMSASESRTRSPTTSRRFRGPVVFDEYEGATARRIGEPSAATRALRFLGTGFEVSEVLKKGEASRSWADAGGAGPEG